MTHEQQHVLDLIPAYALEALDPDELRLVEAHLATCAECRAASDQYRALSHDLLLALPPQPPAPRVRARLITRLAERRGPQGRTPRRWSLGWLAGLGMALLVALNALTLYQVQTLRQQQSNLASQLALSQAALALLAQPGTQVVVLAGEQAKGSLVIDASGKAGMLSTQGLPALDAAHGYQLWLIPPAGAPVSVGVFRPAPGEQTELIPVDLQQPLREFAGVGITVEPAAGSPGPTGPLVLAATLQQ